MIVLACTNSNCNERIEREAFSSSEACPWCGSRLEPCASSGQPVRSANSFRQLINSPTELKGTDKYFEFICEHCQATGRAMKSKRGERGLCAKCRQSTVLLPAGLLKKDRYVDETVPSKRAPVGDTDQTPATVVVAKSLDRQPRESQRDYQRVPQDDSKRDSQRESSNVEARAKPKPKKVIARPTQTQAAQAQLDATTVPTAQPSSASSPTILEPPQSDQSADPQPLELQEMDPTPSQTAQDSAQASTPAETIAAPLEKPLASLSVAEKRQAAERARLAQTEIDANREQALASERAARQRAINLATESVLAIGLLKNDVQAVANAQRVCRNRLSMPLDSLLAEPTGFRVLNFSVTPDVYLRNPYRQRGMAGGLWDLLSVSESRATGRPVSLGYEIHSRSDLGKTIGNNQSALPLFRDLFWLNLPEKILAQVVVDGSLVYSQAQQVLDAMAQKTSGAGLGLALHAAAVVAHNQAICVECAYAAGFAVTPDIFWEDAFLRWHAALEDEGFHSCLHKRSRQLSIALQDGWQDSLIGELSLAILSINISFAQAYFVSENEVAAQRHLACVGRAPLGGPQRDAILDDVVQAIYQT